MLYACQLSQAPADQDMGRERPGKILTALCCRMRHSRLRYQPKRKPSCEKPILTAYQSCLAFPYIRPFPIPPQCTSLALRTPFPICPVCCMSFR